MIKIRSLLSSEGVFYIMFFMPLLGAVIASYLFVFLFFFYYFVLKKRNTTRFGILLGSSIFLYCLFKFFQMGNFENWFVIFRYYFGWAFMLYFLSTSKCSINIEKVIWIFCIEIITEGILINFFISPTMLRNYPLHEGAIDFDAVISSVGFQRPYSIGCNATISATLLCMLLALREEYVRFGLCMMSMRLDLIAFVSLIILASGTGLLLYIVIMIYKYRNIMNAKTIISIIGLGIVFLFFLSISSIGETILFRFGVEALEEMWAFKVEETNNYLVMMNGQSPLMGIDFKNIHLLTQGDLAWIEAYLSIGILGLLLFFAFVKHYINKYNRLPIIIGLVGTIHYSGIFSEPGQLLLAYIALINCAKIGEMRSELNNNYA